MPNKAVSMLRRLLRRSGRRHDPPGTARMRVEALEARVLHSADFGPGVLGAPAAMPQVEHRELDAGGEFTVPAAHETQAEAREVVFIDAATPDYQALVDDVRAGGGRFDVVMLDGNRDGIAQISEALAGRRDLQAVHIISHGSIGALRLGNATLEGRDLGAYADDIAGWSLALAGNADILLYGCDVAASATGQHLVSELARLTGADVAASVDRTGNAAAGGDWDLEYAAGSVESGLAVGSAMQAQWTGVLANASPVLAGAENFASIPEDAASNPGTLVSSLIAGHVTDPDAGALAGIAVTAVDNTNGTWQYSTDGGGSWLAFGTPTATGARLLAADGSTYVRFVPNADWSGTVNNGLTFRAWDQTSGIAGGIANTTTTTSTVRDEFNSVSYANNDGTQSWSSGWVDNDGNASGGAVQIAGGQLQISTLLAGTGTIHRQADLTGATSATLSFSYDNQILIGLGGNVELRISDDGGASYASLITFSSGNSGSGTFSTSITGFISGATRIQFVSSGIAVAQSLFVEDLQISYVTPLASGVTAFSTATASSSVTVTPVNDAPAGTDKTIAIAEDTAYVLTAADFGYTDTHDVPANAFLAVRIASLPAGGTLALGGVAVNAGDTIAISDIAGGDLVYTPALNAAGTGIASFTFQVQDDGGGADLDATPNTIHFDVSPVDDPPAGTNSTVSVAEDGAHTFSAADFGYTDPDTPPQNFVAVTITSLPSAGSLTINGAAVTAGQSISVGLLGAGHLVFTPAPGASGAGHATFTFQVESSGGAPNIDPTPRTMTIDVLAVNDPPAGASGMVATNEDTPYAFNTADFGFSDPDDAPPNALLAVRIATLPAAGTLTLNGTPVSASQFVSAADIAAGLLVFTPAAEANGPGYAAFTFQVQDDGGGADLSLAARTITIDVVAVNDAPVLTNNNGVTVAEASSAGIDAGMLHVSDADNALSQLVYTIGTATAHGHLELTTAPGVAISSFSQDDIANNRLVYVHDGSQTTSDSFGFTVSDGAGGNVGSTVFSITVNGVNDAPAAALPGGQSTAAGSPLVFSTANGNALVLSDADAGGGLVEVSLAATHGNLSLAGTAGLTFLAGTGTGDIAVAFRGTLADINAALDGLAFRPDASFTGAASLSFSADDLGNTGSGGPLTATGSVAISVLALPGPGDTFDPGPAILDPVVPPVIAHPLLPGDAGPSPVIPTDPALPPPEDAAPGNEADPVPEGGSETGDDFSAGSGRIPTRSDGMKSTQESSHAGRGSNVAYGGADIRALLGPIGQAETTFAAFAFSSADTPAPASQAGDAMHSQSLLEGLDRLRDNLQEESKVGFNTMALTTAASLGLSVGYVLWLLRGGVLVSSVLSSLPAWRFVDPLPILGRLEEDDEDADDRDDSLESMVARTNRAAPDEAQPA